MEDARSAFLQAAQRRAFNDATTARLVYEAKTRVATKMTFNATAFDVLDRSHGRSQDIAARSTGSIRVGLRAVDRFLASSMVAGVQLVEWTGASVFAGDWFDMPEALGPVESFPEAILARLAGTHHTGYRDIADFLIQSQHAFLLERPVVGLPTIPGYEFDAFLLRHWPFEKPWWEVAEWYERPIGEHGAALAWRLAVSTLSFVIAHEVSHHQLGHFSADAGGVSQFELEYAADLAALEGLSTDDSADLDAVAALTVFRATAARERSNSTTEASHPTSVLRLLALGRALEMRGASPGVMRSVDALLAVQSGKTTRDERASIRWYLTLWGATFEAILHRNEDQAAPARLRAALDIVDAAGLELERDRVVVLNCHRPDANYVRSNVDGSTSEEGQRLAQLLVPPYWFQRHPDASFKVRDLEYIEASAHIDGKLVPDRHGDDFYRPAESSFLTDASARTLLRCSQWDVRLGYVEAGIELLVRAVDKNPTAVGMTEFLAALEHQVQSGHLQEGAYLAWRFEQTWGRPIPGCRAARAFYAEAEGDRWLQLEHAGLEVFTFGSKGMQAEPASILLGHAMATAEHEGRRPLLNFGKTYNLAQRTRLPGRRRRRLDEAAHILAELPGDRVVGSIVLRQYQAELDHIRVHAGAQELRGPSERHLRDLLEEAEWFTPALVRLAHLRLEAGDLRESMELFDRASEVAPQHEQVTDLFSRLREAAPGLRTKIEKADRSHCEVPDSFRIRGPIESLVEGERLHEFEEGSIQPGVQGTAGFGVS